MLTPSHPHPPPSTQPGPDPKEYEQYAMKAEQDYHLAAMQLSKATSVKSHVMKARAVKSEEDVHRLAALLWDLAHTASVDVTDLCDNPPDAPLLAKVPTLHHCTPTRDWHCS